MHNIPMTHNKQIKNNFIYIYLFYKNEHSLTRLPVEIKDLNK